MAEGRGGRPMSANARPTGGDKAAITGGKRQYFRRKKICRISADKMDYLDYKDTKYLGQFISDRGRILPRRITGVSADRHRELVVAIKRARNIALLPFVTKQ